MGTVVPALVRRLGHDPQPCGQRSFHQVVPRRGAVAARLRRIAAGRLRFHPVRAQRPETGRFDSLRLSGTVCREPAPLCGRDAREGSRAGSADARRAPPLHRRRAGRHPCALCRRRAACGRRSRCSSDRRRAADPRMGVAARGRSVESLLYVGRAGNQSSLARRAAGRHPFQRPRRPRRGADDRRTASGADS